MESGKAGVLDELMAVKAEVTALEQHRDRLVATAREAGTSWRDIGTALGVSGQAAHKRYRQQPDMARTTTADLNA